MPPHPCGSGCGGSDGVKGAISTVSAHNARPPRQRTCKQCGKPATKYREFCTNCYTTHRRKQIAYGRWDNGRAPIGPVRAHLADLVEAGVSAQRTAVLAQVDLRWLQALNEPRNHGGRNRRANPEERAWVDAKLAARVLAVPIPAPGELVDMVTGRARVDATGTRRRLQALMAIGYSQLDIIQRLGMAPTAAYRMWHPHHPRVYACTAQKVTAVYDELAMTPPPNTWMTRRTMAYAAAQGWAPPLAWDEDSIDDPSAEPQPWQQAEPDDFAEVLADYRESGYTDTAIAARLGIQLESLYRRLDRLGVARGKAVS